jgi:agmatinase
LFFAHRGRLDSQAISARILGAIKTQDVYLSLDLDVLDPALISVGTPEPGGILYDELVNFLKLLCRGKRLVGFDMVELCPRAADVAPDFTAAKLVYHLIGLSA